MMSRQTIIHWLNENINKAPTQVPCVEGMVAAKYYLEQTDAKPTEVKSVSKGEIDQTITRWESWLKGGEESNNITFSPWSYMADEIRVLINYVKAAALMPAEPSDEIAECLFNGFRSSFYDSPGQPTNKQREGMKTAYKALYEHLTTPPKPKMKKQWCVARVRQSDTWAEHRVDVCATEKDAQEQREYYLNYRGVAVRYTSVSPIWEQEVEDK